MTNTQNIFRSNFINCLQAIDNPSYLLLSFLSNSRVYFDIDPEFLSYCWSQYDPNSMIDTSTWKYQSFALNFEQISFMDIGMRAIVVSADKNGRVSYSPIYWQIKGGWRQENDKKDKDLSASALDIKNIPHKYQAIFNIALVLMRLLNDPTTRKLVDGVTFSATPEYKAQLDVLEKAAKPFMPIIQRVIYYGEHGDYAHRRHSNYEGGTKSPHRRRATVRHLKNGKVIHVSACKIHADQFEGPQTIRYVEKRRRSN